MARRTSISSGRGHWRIRRRGTAAGSLSERHFAAGPKRADDSL